MGDVGIRFEGPWARLVDMAKAGGFDKKLRVHMLRAQKINAPVLAKAIKRKIRQAGTLGHSLDDGSLSAAIKGHHRPLHDTSELHNSVTWKVQSWEVAYAGVIKGTVDEKRLDAAVMLHDGSAKSGIRYRVTPKMRAMFSRLANAYERGGAAESSLTGRALELWIRGGDRVEWTRIGKDKQYIEVVKGWPFLEWAVHDQELRQIVFHNWMVAIARSFGKNSKAGEYDRGRK